ncbi:MAG: hypothetical protein JXA33_09330 [Anaerolineae bacterium]|nr:hypothetical protein [Anaerolineae bacterium]
MPRPGLIVGLGGTGQWVLTWLKRDLLLSNNGVMPKNVRLLEIDTCTRLEAGASRVMANGKKEEAAEVGGVMLGESEFVYIGGDAHPLAQQIKEQQSRDKEQVARWFHAGRWLSTQSPRTFILDEGAGRLRQFGRLAIFKDLKGEEAGSRIWPALRTAIEEIRSVVTQQSSLEIVVVGSFAGGTGSGLFIDTALILRLLAQQLNVHHILRGMFALPSVFTIAPDAEMKARSFAAWRELNRFMIVDPDFPVPEIRYVSTNPNFRIQPNQRLFDACYLVDGKRRGQPIAQEAKYGVFPMLAETLSAILDDQAGTAYTQWLFTNLALEYAKRPETPMYSAVGAYTIQVPAYFIQEHTSYEYGQAMLLRLLSPKRESIEDGRLMTSGAERHLELAAPDRNQEDRGFTGRMRSLTLLSDSVSYEDQSSKPTLFHNRIVEIVKDALDQNRRQSSVELLARGGIDRASWVTYFPNLGDDPRFETTRRAVAEQMQYNIPKQYRRRTEDKETASEARARFKQIPNDLRTRFGGISAAGEEVEEFHGTCGDALQGCEYVQLTTFRQLVQLRLLSILNGQSDDALVAKSGKLGYAWDYFDGLANELNGFLDLMRDVRKRREEVKPEIRLAGMSKQAQDFLNATADKKIFWFWEHPKVKGAELEYLNAQQRLMEIRREDILHFYVVETVREMIAICEQVCNTLQRWIWHLSTGDNANQLPGLWDGIRNAEQELQNAHSYDTVSPKVQQLIANIDEGFSDEDIRHALGLWQWSATFANDRFDLRARIQPQTTGETTYELSDPTLGSSSEFRRQIGQQNLEALLMLARRRFSSVAARTTVAEEIKRKYPDPKKFAEEIADISAEPLFDGTGSGCVKKSNLIRVKIADSDPYFIGADGLEGHLRGIHHLNRAIRDDVYGIQVVGSEHPYKLTFVRTDDLYTYDSYKAWNECLASYQVSISQEGGELDPVLLHNFMAEIEAVRIEQQLVRSGTEYRTLHPRVVVLLEDRIALEQFINFYMFGMIKESSASETLYRWELTWDRGEPQTLWLTKGWDKQKQAYSPKPDIFDAIHGYVIIKKTQQIGFNYAVDTEFARILISQHLSKIGQLEEREMLHYHLEDRKGLVKELKHIGYDYVGDQIVRVLRQQYVDLADVVRLILEERLRKLDTAQSSRDAEAKHQQEEAEKEILTTQEQKTVWQFLLTLSAVQVVVGQVINIQVTLEPVLTGSNTFELPANVQELYCFIEADGLQNQSDDVIPIPLIAQTDQPSPIIFTLQAHLCGDRPYTIELFAEDPQSGRMHIFKTSGQITVLPPTAELPKPILAPLNIQVAARPDFTLRAITEFPDGKDSSRCVTYHLASRLPGLWRGEKPVGRIALSDMDIAQMRGLLNQALYIAAFSQPEDARARMLAMGDYLFNRLFPVETTTPFHEALRQAAGRLHTWLIIDDNVTWLPWEVLAHDWLGTGQPQFLSEQFRVSRWIVGLGPKPYSEIPLGDIALAHYRLQEAGREAEDEAVESWRQLFDAQGAYGILQVVKPETPFYALHLLRYIDPSAESRSIVARASTGEGVEASPESEPGKAKLDIRLKRPVVTLGLLADVSTQEREFGADWLLPERALPFVRAGASAVVGPWWPTSEAADRVFWSTFYDLLRRRVSLGESVWRARLAVQQTLPEQTDWLAYTLFGDPLAEPYWPEFSEGYTALECLSNDDPLIVGKAYRFRASIRSRPPIWYQDRLIDVEDLPQDPRVLFLAPGILDEIPEPVQMELVGRTMVQAITELTPQEEGQFTLIARLFDGDERLQVLRLQLKVGRQKRTR